MTLDAARRIVNAADRAKKDVRYIRDISKNFLLDDEGARQAEEQAKAIDKIKAVPVAKRVIKNHEKEMAKGQGGLFAGTLKEASQ